MPDKCPICKAEDPGVSGRGGVPPSSWSCPRCGDFFLDNHLVLDLIENRVLKNDIQRAVLSHWIRTQYESRPPDEQGHKNPVVLRLDLVESIIRNPRPPLADQADNLVRWLGDNTKAGGDHIHCSELALQAIVGAATVGELLFVFDHLKAQEVITGERQLDKSSGTKVMQVAAALSFSGVQRYLDLGRNAPNSRTAFMAMQYNESSLDDIVNNVFKPAIKQTGFDLFPLRDRPRAGLIDDNLRVAIRTSRFLIADLTHENAGAYWEAGYAEGLGKPVIYTCEKTKFEESKTHFDTNHHLTVRWDSEKPKETADELKATIRATLPAEAKLTDD